MCETVTLQRVCYVKLNKVVLAGKFQVLLQ
jgi:hypothetical protein